MNLIDNKKENIEKGAIISILSSTNEWPIFQKIVKDYIADLEGQVNSAFGGKPVIDHINYASIMSGRIQAIEVIKDFFFRLLPQLETRYKNSLTEE